MLSRVAYQVYWLARYLERTEGTARLLSAYHLTRLDVPRSMTMHWEELIHVNGAHEVFANRYRRHDERNVVNFLLSDPTNPGSVLTSASAARENLRTTREVFPSEIWEAVNGLYHFTRDECAGATARRRRYQFLSRVIEHCQLIMGMLTGTMSRDTLYQFLAMGFNLERVDMTTRILDVGAAALGAQSEVSEQLHDALWLNIVKAVNAEQMFRRRRIAVSGESVVGFLLHDPSFPRSVMRCLDAISTSMGGLPRDRKPRIALTRFIHAMKRSEVSGKDLDDLRKGLDQLQLELARLHQRIASTWFPAEH